MLGIPKKNVSDISYRSCQLRRALPESSYFEKMKSGARVLRDDAIANTLRHKRLLIRNESNFVNLPDGSSVGPGVHCYSPFLKSSNSSSTINLEELCKNTILRCITLRRLATGVNKLPLPKLLKRYITELTTEDFEQIECAPFCDVFSFNFFHRALTYRVVCLRDKQEYIITYGCSPVEDEKLIAGHKEWVKVQHKNIMCICATVKDTSTNNVFYVYDQPFASLGQFWSVFCEKTIRYLMYFYAFDSRSL
ncbi:SOCS box domain-containing protein [Caerostris extrusa]|uniref:SOCS box domain-containing protein n=1 Tax=Caerostris extrusa TaxID=172846 RepID=A0AAV4QV29_CAEEX|nr:SOCS box domain-containing protein [Caerostris extrusa]